MQRLLTTADEKAHICTSCLLFVVVVVVVVVVVLCDNHPTCVMVFLIK